MKSNNNDSDFNPNSIYSLRYMYINAQSENDEK